DSIATMAGAIAGAWRGFDALPEDKYAFFRAVNNKDFDIEAIASGLTLLALQAQEK
ncbi:ADP-ribosylglycohydrolase family protein, partial [Escherichia coli]|nr:ADP-ribosylglycohydrolase family protein [Escherichia coli]